MDAQADTDARIIRDQLTALRGWIGHWKDDAECKQICTLSSLILAQSHVDNALAVLDRMQAEQRAAA
ncbi:hypothetical protein GGQ99_001334 [Aminobacter niigataensis]|uniref:Uncharacterized protein n=1 Tax=Aminobacter niigataensis TaxID=83265 RepID=A0ABR6KYK5_9HYPH|nr:hypothetical protein [Aminobacter niigataensis]MBB4649612.1 hypothetical protein [Aminobacter niigataensis]